MDPPKEKLGNPNSKLLMYLLLLLSGLGSNSGKTICVGAIVRWRDPSNGEGIAAMWDHLKRVNMAPWLPPAVFSIPNRNAMDMKEWGSRLLCLCFSSEAMTGVRKGEGVRVQTAT